MRKIPQRKRMEIVKLYFEGYSYDDIAERTGVSKGAIANIVSELRKTFDESDASKPFEQFECVDELREIATKIRKRGLTISQASLGLRFFERLKELVEPEELDEFIRMCRKISPPDFPVSKFVFAAMELLKLEERAGKPWDDALEGLKQKIGELESAVRELEGVKKAAMHSIEQLEKKKKDLKQELVEAEKKLGLLRAELERKISLHERLNELGLEKVERLASFIEDYERLGYDAQLVRELARLKEELETANIELEKLKELVELKKAIIHARRRIDFLKEVENGLKAKISDIERVYRVMQMRSFPIYCRYCGYQIQVMLKRKACENALNSALYVRCPRCGAENYFDPRIVLMSIGLMVLD